MMPSKEPSRNNARKLAQPKPKPRAKSTELAESRQATDLDAPGYPGGFDQNTFEYHAAMLSDGRLSHPMYARQRNSYEFPGNHAPPHEQVVLAKLITPTSVGEQA